MTLLIVALLAALGLSIGGTYWASQQSPPFYAEALAQDPLVAQKASDVMVRRTAALASEIRRPGRWQALFTTEQVNGWLAYDMQKNHPHLLSADVTDPRVSFEKDRLQIAFRWRRPAWSTIVSLEAQVYLRETNVVAVRIRNARAGKLPLPLGSFLTDFIAAGHEVGLEMEQQLVEGDPLLLITLPSTFDSTGRQLSLDALELHAGELLVAGACQRPGELTLPPLARTSSGVEDELPGTGAAKRNIHR